MRLAADGDRTEGHQGAERARRLFAAVTEHVPDLEAFYATIYHAALRPDELQELQELRLDQLTLAGRLAAFARGWRRSVRVAGRCCWSIPPHP